jgi:heme oxygenase (biliverdin-IX-beta and delta-forming)
MILQRLKHETRSYHEQLERSLNICDEHLTLARYTHILEQFLGFYQPVELLFSTFQQRHILNREVERRSKTLWLLQDLNALGIADADLAALPTCTDLPTLDTLYHALGCMYVLEGATLGGQIIARHIQRVLRLDQHRGCTFFHGYGCDTGTMWKAFGELLVTHIANREAENAVIFAVCETFTLFHQWLVIGANV